ncbi:uncharacterized protein LOC131219269 [Magnolia sinica]|uniref:uncharacterized protein LOC131219269 n=1 Tax=Magnolia sinica TaxID=86752 RepID=UPI002658ECAC|nr:uncharacterized protein LOC131219269 [Magnolia sinica]
MVFKDNKRPLNDDDPYQLSCKHPRQLGYDGIRLASFLETGPCNIPEKPHISVGEGEESFNKPQHEEMLVSHAVSVISAARDKEFDVSAFGSISSLSWVTSSTGKEDLRSESGLPISCSPRFLDYDRLTRSLVPSEEIYSSSLLDYPHRKPVSLGPDHQVDVPEWGLEGTKNSAPAALDVDTDASAAFPQSSIMPSSGLRAHPMMDDSNWEKLVGTCVVPMLDADASAHSRGDVGHGRTDCKCTDVGSVRCVRQHVMEARDKLKEMIGQEPFMELGFCEMGENVAQRWSEEEEQVFHAVVFSNPASAGKNFWEHLSRVFPNRTKKELVSYYFNVFMLRRRAEQNRTDPLNIDSDNDEWQGSDDGGEFAMTEEEEDSAVESPVDQEHVVYYGDGAHEDCHEDDDDEDDDFEINNDGGAGDDDDDDDDDVVASEDDDGGLDDVSEAHVSNVPSLGKLQGCSLVPINQNAGNNPQNGSEDQDVQDDSCTSYECQRNGTDSYGPADVAATHESQVEIGRNKSLHGEYGNDILSGLVDHGYLLEPPCEAKAWDIGFLPGPKEDVDFLSTFNMIEEVFGDEGQSKNETRDGPGKS